VSSDNRAFVKEADIVLLSVKPQAMNKLLEEIAPAVDDRKLIVSIAAGVPIEAIERKLGHGRGMRIVRCMPNTPALVGAGATALSPGEHATEADLAQARALFDAVGKTAIVDETLLDAVTGLSGSGPAYIFLVIEALADAGVKVGLDRRTAQEPRRDRHRRPAHARGGRPAHHAHERRGGRHQAVPRARQEVPRGRSGRVADGARGRSRRAQGWPDEARPERAGGYMVVSQVAYPQARQVKQPPLRAMGAPHCGQASPFLATPAVSTCPSREPSR
jgi:hypothetical protein